LFQLLGSPGRRIEIALPYIPAHLGTVAVRVLNENHFIRALP